MHQDMAIWCPVVITNLVSPRLFRQKNRHQMNERYKRIEDLKVRIKTSQSQVQGNFVETKVGVAWLCLLEDYQGRSCSIRREEVLKDRVPLQDFDHMTEQQYELRYTQDINSFSWDAEIKDRYLLISYDLNYRLMGTREQLVFVQASNQQVNVAADHTNAMQLDGLEDINVEENLKLRRQLYFYETNLSSLKKGIQKVEKDNYALNVELRGYRDMVKELRDAMANKDRIIGSNLDDSTDLETYRKKPWTVYETNKLGQRIKNLFVNNL